MTQERPNAGASPMSRCTCTACPLVCDDILIAPEAVKNACHHGRETILEAMSEDRENLPNGRPVDAWEQDRPVARREAIERAARMLASARRVLVTGLSHATLESITVACDLAETLGAAIDDGLSGSAQVAGPTIARAGEVTAVWEEVRDRADVVLFWYFDPSSSHPRFVERFVTPTMADGRHRRTIAIGPSAVMPAAEVTHDHHPLAGHLAVEAARLLQMRLSGRPWLPDDAALCSACIALEEAIRSAECVAIVTGSADPVGLDIWSIVHLIRTISHEKPAFHVPLAGGLAGGEHGANIAGARAVCTWRYGAAGSIARADRTGGAFEPAESDARRLIDRGEVDAVISLGGLPDACERAIVGRGDSLSLVRICDQTGPPMSLANPTVQIRCASGTIATPGTVLREDGRRVVLTPHRASAGAQMRDVLVELLDAVRRSLSMPALGGRP